MIKDKTVLVLGAGASSTYGLPLGKELVRNIIEEIRRADFFSKFVIEHYPDKWRPFTDRLIYSDCDSVDAFLEKEENQDLLQIGKESIAACILPREGIDHLFEFHNKKPSWYNQLRSRLFDGVSFSDMPQKNNLTIITFNYDRSLEYYLTRTISETFQKSMEDSAKCLQETVKIIHVHGKFGPLPHEVQNPELSISYQVHSEKRTPDKWSELLRFAASNIKIIHEALDDTPEFIDAHKCLRDANKIFFFGFGFHPTNCRRLKLDKLVDRNPKVCFTYKGLSADRIKSLYGYRKQNGYTRLFEMEPHFLESIIDKTIYEFIDEVGIL